MRAGLLFTIDGRFCSGRLTILHTVHLFIAFTFNLSFLFILLLFFIAFGFEILEVSQPPIFWKFLMHNRRIKLADLACSIIIIHFSLCNCRLLSAIHLNIFTFSASWTGFYNFSFFFLRLIRTICSFVIRKCICLGLIWGEFRWCGSFRVPDKSISNNIVGLVEAINSVPLDSKSRNTRFLSQDIATNFLNHRFTGRLCRQLFIHVLVVYVVSHTNKLASIIAASK